MVIERLQEKIQVIDTEEETLRVISFRDTSDNHCHSCYGKGQISFIVNKNKKIEQCVCSKKNFEKLRKNMPVGYKLEIYTDDEINDLKEIAKKLEGNERQEKKHILEEPSKCPVAGNTGSQG